MKCSFNPSRRTWLGFLLLLLLSQGLAGNQPQAVEKALYLVYLKEPSVVEKVLSQADSRAVQTLRSELKSDAALRHRAWVERSQQQLIERLTGRRQSNLLSSTPISHDDIELLDRRSFLVNLLVVRTSPATAERVRADSAVKSMVEAKERFLLLDTATHVIQAPSYWEAIPGGFENAGRGIRIGIIDSGINQHHPMFDDQDLVLPRGYPRGHELYTNRKVIVARSYHNLFPNPQPNQTPEDEMGHGSRVASVAAGRQVDAPLAQIQGVAPMAYLGNYKIFGAPGLNQVTTSAAIIVALNDAVEDGMDVVNLSLGGDAVDPVSDPEQQAIALAVGAGVVVVVAAGNGGPGLSTIKSPGTSPEAITVGAVTNGRTFSSFLETSAYPEPPEEIARVAYLPGQDVSIPEPIGPLPMASVQTLDPSELACDPLPPGSLTGNIVLVRRGTCLFQEKADNVFAAGAEALVVYNNLDSSPIVMAFDTQRGAGGPAIMIAKAGGERLRDNILGTTLVTATIRSEDDLARFPDKEGIVTGFSSRGPNVDFSIKPDLSAVGTGLYSASKVAAEFTKDSNGTSFSSPMVAGAAALVLQLHPDWTPETIKSVLVETANKNVTWKGKPAGANLTGNGLLDLAEALQASAVVNPVSISFGEMELPRSLETRRDRTILLKDLGGVGQVLDLEVVETISSPSARLTVHPPKLSLLPETTETITLTLSSEPPLVDGPFEGYIQIKNREVGTKLTLAYWGDILPTDETEVLEVHQSTPGAFHDLAQALRAASPGSIIQIGDSGTYSAPLIIASNAEGTPLDGIKITALPGKSPVIDGTGVAGNSAVVVVKSLRDITIEGLEIRGGLQGLEMIDSTGLVRNNRISGNPHASSGFGIVLTNSRVHLVDNEIFGTGGSAVYVLGGDALIQGNRIGGTDNLGMSSGNGIAVQSGGRLSIFDNLIEKSENGQGIRISDATALVKGNIIVDFRGELGDGIRAEGPSALFEIRDNLITNNQGSGVSLNEAASGRSLRDRLHQNLNSALKISDRSSMEANSLELLQNGVGIQLTESSAIIANSLVAFSASEGIVSDRSILELINSTLFGNAGHGLVAFSPVETLVGNSIFSENQKGNLLGIEESDVFNNLIADGQFQGVNGNLSGDPLMADPWNRFFSLLSTSPAIDSGDNLLSMGPRDLYSQQRIVDGSGDGVAAADLGALEYASDSSNPLRLPVLSLFPDQWCGIAIANAETLPGTEAFAGPERPDSASMVLRSHDTDGFQTRTKAVYVPRLSQESWLLTELFDEYRDGWIELLPTGPDTVSFALMGNWETSILDGVPLTSSLAESVIFPEIRNHAEETTTVFLINPNPSEILVELTWKNPSRSDPHVTRNIPAGGMLKFTFREMFGEGDGGYLIAESIEHFPIYGMELFGSKSALGALAGLDSAKQGQELYAAQLASSDDVRTVLNVINRGTQMEDVTFEAVSEQGALLATAQESLAGGSQLRKSATELFGFDNPVKGWVRVYSATPSLTGALLFEDPAGRWLTALPLQSEGAREFILSHVAHDDSIFTGVTLLNASFEDALVSFEVLDRAGTVSGSTYLRLPAGRKRALLLDEWVSGFKQQSGGFIRVRSSLGILGFELFGSHDLDYMSAVPQQVTLY